MRAAARVVSKPPGRHAPVGVAGDLARRGYNKIRDTFEARRK
jgi:hypothetical protein